MRNYVCWLEGDEDSRRVIIADAPRFAAESFARNTNLWRDGVVCTARSSTGTEGHGSVVRYRVTRRVEFNGQIMSER